MLLLLMMMLLLMLLLLVGMLGRLLKRVITRGGIRRILLLVMDTPNVIGLTCYLIVQRVLRRGRYLVKIIGTRGWKLLIMLLVVVMTRR